MGERLFCMLLHLLLFPVSLTAAAAAYTYNTSFLPLSAGLDLRMPPSFNTSDGSPLSLDLLFTVAIPTLDEGGLFFPILTSPSFITNYTSNRRSFGFSLGFYFLPLSPYVDTSYYGGCKIYMAVCAGSFGHNYSDTAAALAISNELLALYPIKTIDGFAVPIWIANLDSPIRYADKASLMVTDSKGSTTLDLQLRDGEKTVWRVHNVSMMEINEDTGHLLIYDSPNRAHLVWQSPTDSLVEGNSLTPGMELVSYDSSYVAKMEKGGLVFYMNKTHFNMNKPPYWLFPVARYDPKSLDFNINGLISSAPCKSSPAHADADALSFLPVVALYPGSCISNDSFYNIRPYGNYYSYDWSFWKLESDGKLYSYTVVLSSASGYGASVTRTALGIFYNTSRYSVSITPPFLEWQECNVPMACGPLGVCTPGAKTVCSCSEPDFEPVNQTDVSQGCKRSTKLPNCTFGKGHTGSMDFVQLDSTASIFLFSGWTFNSTHAQVNACKQICSSDCSCNGFFYQNNTSSCFFITDAIGLMKVADKNLTFVLQNPEIKHEVLAQDYVTFLKVTSSSGDPMIALGGITLSRAAMIALGATISAVTCLVLLGMAGYLFKARRQKYVRNRMLANEDKELQEILPLLPSRFSYKDLFEATEGFTKLLGAGGCGSVYAGVLSDGRKVAVKVLKIVLQGTEHSKQFLAEIAAIGRTGHHNVVRLVGFCWEVSQRILVYEYVERGSLDRWIFVRESVAPVDDTCAAGVAAPLLDWKTRYNVALGIARGLNYLHEDCEQAILHFDIKPQNILLDTDFVAKLADFGMSRLVERDMSTVVTGMRGTPGYIAPEWSSQGTVSKKSDVYSMGMVLLEIVGGRRNLDFSLLNSSFDPVEQEAWHFPSFAARKCEQGLMMELVDGRLHVCGFDAAQALRLIHIAFWCIQEEPAMRPNAPTVVQWLEGDSPIEQPPFCVAGKRPKTKLPISFCSSEL